MAAGPLGPDRRPAFPAPVPSEFARLQAAGDIEIPKAAAAARYQIEEWLGRLA